MLYILILMLQVTPAELIDVDFRKPKRMNSKSVASADEQDTVSVFPTKKTKVATGPQDVPKISAETLYRSIYKSAPQACLFTIVPGFERQQGQGSIENTQQVALSEQTVEPMNVLADDLKWPTVLTDDPEELAVLADDDPEQLAILADDDPEQLAVLADDDPEQLAVLADDPEQQTVPTD